MFPKRFYNLILLHGKENWDLFIISCVSDVFPEEKDASNMSIIDSFVSPVVYLS